MILSGRENNSGLMTGPGLYVLTSSGQNTLFPLGTVPCCEYCSDNWHQWPQTLFQDSHTSSQDPCCLRLWSREAMYYLLTDFGRFSHCTSGWAGTHYVAVMANLHCQFVSLQFWRCLWCFQRLTEERRACLNVMTPTYHSGGPRLNTREKEREARWGAASPHSAPHFGTGIACEPQPGWWESNQDALNLGQLSSPCIYISISPLQKHHEMLL